MIGGQQHQSSMNMLEDAEEERSKSGYLICLLRACLQRRLLIISLQGGKNSDSRSALSCIRIGGMLPISLFCDIMESAKASIYVFKIGHKYRPTIQVYAISF